MAEKPKSSIPLLNRSPISADLYSPWFDTEGNACTIQIAWTGSGSPLGTWLVEGSDDPQAQGEERAGIVGSQSAATADITDCFTVNGAALALAGVAGSALLTPVRPLPRCVRVFYDFTSGGAGATAQAFITPRETSIVIMGTASDSGGGGGGSTGDIDAVNAGTGLTGGGTTGSVTLNVVYGTLPGTAAQGNDSRLSNDRTASGIRTATTTVSVSGATAPTNGQVLTATSGTNATWQTPAAGGSTNLTALSTTAILALSSPVAGQQAFNTTTKLAMVNDGTNWNFTTDPDGATAAIVMPSGLAAEWDASYGIGNNTWTDIKGGVVLTGSGSPAYASAGITGKGLPGWNFVAAASQGLASATLGAPIIAISATSYYIAMVVKLTNAAPGADRNLFNIGNAAASTDIGFFFQNSSSSIKAYGIGGALATGSAANTNVHFLELFQSGTTRTFAVDGTTVSTDSSGGAVANSLEKIAVANIPTVGQFNDQVVYGVRIATSVPSADQRTTFLLMARRIWGF